MYSVEGRRVLVTGAASGIGRATARLLGEAGARPFLLDCDEAGLEQEAGRLRCGYAVVDLLEHDGIAAAVAWGAEALGGLDAVVNVAGITRKREIDEVSAADWADLLGVNLLAPFWVIRHGLPYLRLGNDPAIVNVSSGTALRPTIAGYSTYAASKGGLLTMTKAMAFELAPTIRVNVVCPGATISGILSEEDGAALANGPDSPYALRRSAKADEVARAICFLAAPDASYITGATLAVDGGRTFY